MLPLSKPLLTLDAILDATDIITDIFAISHLQGLDPDAFDEKFWVLGAFVGFYLIVDLIMVAKLKKDKKISSFWIFGHVACKKSKDITKFTIGLQIARSIVLESVSLVLLLKFGQTTDIIFKMLIIIMSMLGLGILGKLGYVLLY